ncbi:hypothetical protein [Bradyrhizobium vignae]|uniref:hypothetical protein n=1 Tax=Bradyrhizobium vignae TaxID=1549949 RepID=UPI00100C10BA|nr:hypothetical protein [Bradyrhizobium vignae]RXH02799.1 hypothetical protein EAV90_15285 [Bradyrhizobium vignae]
MNKRTDPSMAFAASAQNLRKALRDSAPGRQVTGTTEESCRTTLTVSEDLHRAVRRLAADARCKINDVFVIAIEDALRKKQALPGNPSRLDLRRRLGFPISQDEPSTPPSSDSYK